MKTVFPKIAECGRLDHLHDSARRGALSEVVRPILRLALVAALVLGLSPSLAGAAQTTTTVSVGSSCTGPGQLCKPLAAAGSYVARSPLSITYTAAGSHCSNVAVHFFVDGKEEASTGFAPPSGSVSATVPWPNDGLSHDLGVEGEGQTGGCNAGSLGRLGRDAGNHVHAGAEVLPGRKPRAPSSRRSVPLCCSISITGHATREPTDVVTRLPGDPRCSHLPPLPAQAGRRDPRGPAGATEIQRLAG